MLFLARDVPGNIYISHLCYDVSVRLPVCDGSAWAHIANVRFKFRSKFTAYCRRGWGHFNNISRYASHC